MPGDYRTRQEILWPKKCFRCAQAGQARVELAPDSQGPVDRLAHGVAGRGHLTPELETGRGEDGGGGAWFRTVCFEHSKTKNIKIQTVKTVAKSDFTFTWGGWKRAR